MLNLRNHLANHELDIAKYYMAKKAYLAAANRGAYIMSQYNGAEAMPNALAIMVTAYNALDMHKLANDALAILEQNFPDLAPQLLAQKY